MKEVSIIFASSPLSEGNCQNWDSVPSIDREWEDLEPLEGDKENSSKHRGSASLVKQRKDKPFSSKDSSIATGLRDAQCVDKAVLSPHILLSQSPTEDPSKVGILLERPEHCASPSNKHPLETKTLHLQKSSTNKTKKWTDVAETAMEIASTKTISKVYAKAKNKAAAIPRTDTAVRRSNRLKRKPLRFDTEYNGLGSLQKPEALPTSRGNDSDDSHGNDSDDSHDEPTSIQKLELLFKTCSTPLPFCDPFSSIYSFGSIGDAKLDPLCPDPYGRAILRADIFAPEGVFSSVELLSQLNLGSSTEAEPKPPHNVRLADDIYEGRKIADMPLPEYCRMLRSIAHGSSETADRAHDILRGTIQQYRDCVGIIRPDGACFNAVIHGYAQLGYAAAAENVLSLMFQEYMINDNDLAKPNVRVYTNVLHAWRKSKSLDAHERCEDILEEMQRLSDTGIAPECKPDTYAYTVLFHCLAESDCAEASEIAERQFQKMKKGSKSVQLDAIAYSNLLNIFTKNPSTHDRAEKLLWEMVADYEGGNNKAKPHTRNFNTVLAMWAKSTDPDSARRAQSVVESLIQLQEKRTIDAHPDEYTYSLLLKSWVSRGKSGIDHAVNCLYWMEQRHLHGDRAAKLDTIKYTTCISALAREGFPHRAEILLKKMECDHRHGNKQARPDVKNFETVINSWSGFYGTDHEIDETRAENLLRAMWTLGQQPAFAHIRPGVLAYTRVVEATAKRSDPERAENLLNEMIKLNKVGRLPVGPDLHTFHVVVDAWSNSERKDRLVRAGQLRTRMNRHFGIGN